MAQMRLARYGGVSNKVWLIKDGVILVDNLADYIQLDSNVRLSQDGYTDSVRYDYRYNINKTITQTTATGTLGTKLVQIIFNQDSRNISASGKWTQSSSCDIHQEFVCNVKKNGIIKKVGFVLDRIGTSQASQSRVILNQSFAPRNAGGYSISVDGSSFKNFQVKDLTSIVYFGVIDGTTQEYDSILMGDGSSWDVPVVRSVIQNNDVDLYIKDLYYIN